MSDQTWKKAILAIYWLLWEGHSALIEIFINNSHPGHLGCALPICPCRGNAALESYLRLWWKYQITTTDHGHDKRRGMGEGSSFDFLFEIWASTQNWKKLLKIEEYLHDFTGAAAPVLVLSSGVGLPWSRVAEKCPLSCCCSPVRRSELRLEASSPNNSWGRNC